MKQIIYLLLLFNIYLFSNEPSVKTYIDKKEVLIGEAINLNLEVTSPDKYNLIFPNLTDTLSKFEIISKGKIDTVIKENEIVYKQNLQLITFDSGYFDIPSLKILYHLKNDKSKFIDYRSLSTNSYGIKVNSMQIDTSATFKDIKPLIEVPFSIWEIIEYIYIVLILIVLFIAGYFIYKKYFKNKEKEEVELPFDPKIPADVLALEALRKLDKEKLWQNDEYKEYYTQLTDILRIYILRVFEFEAMDMTSSEIIENIKPKQIQEKLVLDLKYILENSDLAKFAKERPLPDINMNTMAYAISFVENTRSLIKKNEDEG